MFQFKEMNVLENIGITSIFGLKRQEGTGWWRKLRTRRFVISTSRKKIIRKLKTGMLR
jgi:hypothetical protein